MDEPRGETRPEPLYRTQEEPRLRLLIPLVCACALFMEALDQTIIATSLPQIAASLGESPLHLNLAITSYLLSLAVFIPISGWIADRFGARTVFCVAVGVFTVASALCGAANSLTMLVVMRVLQGVGGALMNPVGRLVMLKSFPRSEIVVAMGYVMMPAMIGPALGPLVGGFLTTYASWRWIFFINVPIGCLGIALALRYFDNFRSDALARFDFAGFVLCAVGLAAVQLALEFAGRQRISNLDELLIIAVAVLFLGLYVPYARRTHDPVIDLELFRIKTFWVGNVGGTVARIGYGSTPFLLPLLLQLALGFSAFHSGLFTSLTAVSSMAMRVVTPRILKGWGFRTVLLVNGTIVGVLMMGLALITGATPWWALAGLLVVLGFFRSLQYTSLSSLGYADLAGRNISPGSSLASVMQQLSQSFGIAISATLLGLFAGPVANPTQGDFATVFLVMAVFPLASLLWFARLAPGDGALMTGHRAPAVQ
ncbi:MAG TPA: DHA2 family efflux MFS transporter permease subunit [Stellaceae bacterium]|nr:DHA2 family efflux MFS transporter permease subunit [Stellaceae bacterium]